MKAILAKMLLNEKGEVSFMKLGAGMLSLSGFVLSLPATLPTIGISMAIPAAVIVAAKLIGLAGLYIGGSGARDALGAKGTTVINMPAPVQPKADSQG